MTKLKPQEREKNTLTMTSKTQHQIAEMAIYSTMAQIISESHYRMHGMTVWSAKEKSVIASVKGFTAIRQTKCSKKCTSNE